jgi:hypothetical protein
MASFGRLCDSPTTSLLKYRHPQSFFLTSTHSFAISCRRLHIKESHPRRRTAETYITMPETAPPPPPPGWQDTDPSILPEFLKNLPPRPDVSQYPQFPDDKQPSFSGYGSGEARQVTRILENAGISCCICGVGALIYYGAARVRSVRGPNATQ